MRVVRQQLRGSRVSLLDRLKDKEVDGLLQNTEIGLYVLNQACRGAWAVTVIEEFGFKGLRKFQIGPGCLATNALDIFSICPRPYYIAFHAFKLCRRHNTPPSEPKTSLPEVPPPSTPHAVFHPKSPRVPLAPQLPTPSPQAVQSCLQPS